MSSLHHRLAGEDVDLDTAVFATASSGRVVSDRLVATLTFNLHTRRRDTLTSEERADACSTVVREGVVHAVRTRVVGVIYRQDPCLVSCLMESWVETAERNV